MCLTSGTPLTVSPDPPSPTQAEMWPRESWSRSPLRAVARPGPEPQLCQEHLWNCRRPPHPRHAHSMQKGERLDRRAPGASSSDRLIQYQLGGLSLQARPHASAG